MSAQSIQNSALRLAGQVPARIARDDDRVARANREAAIGARLLSHDDLKSIFAHRVEESLEHGRAAILPPEKRARLVDVAARMGLRPFEAHLVIAMVQDEARRPGAHSARDEAGVRRLTLVPVEDDHAHSTPSPADSPRLITPRTRALAAVIGIALTTLVLGAFAAGLLAGALLK